MSKTNLVRFRRRGVFVYLKDSNIMVIVIEAKKDAETLALVCDLHSQNIPIKMLGRFEIAHFKNDVSNPFNRHFCPRKKSHDIRRPTDVLEVPSTIV